MLADSAVCCDYHADPAAGVLGSSAVLRDYHASSTAGDQRRRTRHLCWLCRRGLSAEWWDFPMGKLVIDQGKK